MKKAFAMRNVVMLVAIGAVVYLLFNMNKTTSTYSIQERMYAPVEASPKSSR